MGDEDDTLAWVGTAIGGPDAIVTAEPFATAAGGCWNAEWHDGKGSGPLYRRNVYQRVRWCSNEASITSWNVITQYGDHGWACQVQDFPHSFRVQGGVGAFDVEVRTRGSFKCSFQVFSLTDWIDVDVRYLAGGGMVDV